MTPVLPRDPAVRAKWLAVAAVGGAAFTAFLVGLKSPDGFHLLALGRALVRAGGLPAMEPFVYPLADQPFIGSSWLSGLLLYASHALAGDAGPVVLAAALGAATLAVMARDATREARSAAALAAALLPVALAIAVHRPRVAPRPEAVAFLCLAATLLLVRRWENGEARRLWLLPALFLMWANAHQSVAAGAAILGVTLVVALAHRAVARRGAPPAPDLKPLALWSGAALLASLLSPSGWTQFRTAAGFVLSSVAPPSPGAGGGAYSMLRTMVMELGPIPREDWLGPFGALTCLSAVAFAAGFNRSTPRQLAVAAGAFVLAVSAWRYESLAAIVVAPMAGRHLALAVERLGTRRGVAVATLALSAAGLVAAAAWAVATPYARFGVAVEPWGLPVRTAEYLRGKGFTGRLFNTFHFGGYLEWTLDRPVFQDGRGGLKPEDAAPALMETGHWPQFARLDARYRFDALLIARPPLTPYLAARAAQAPNVDVGAPREGWALVAFDDASLLYLRRDGSNAADAARDEYRYVMPANPIPFPSLRLPGQAPAVLGDLQRAVNAAPECRRCRSQLAQAMAELGQVEVALKVLEPVLEGGAADARSDVLLTAGELSWAQGDREAARRRAREVVRLGVAAELGRRMLALWAIEERRFDEAEALLRENVDENPDNLTDRRLLDGLAQQRGPRR